MKRIAQVASGLAALSVLMPGMPWAQNPPVAKLKKKSSRPARKPASSKSRDLQAATQIVLPAPPRPNPAVTTTPGTTPSFKNPTPLMSNIPGIDERPEKPIKVDPAATLPVGGGALWGFADLHAHPASHLAFGANENGDNGVFHGKPGLALNAVNLAGDLPPCSNDSHSGFDLDYVRKAIRTFLIEKVGEITGLYHGSGGYPRFQGWPHAQSVLHQQMHITNIRRAYDGGLRLMIASVTDNQLMSKLWTSIGFNLFGNDIPKPEEDFDYKSAKRQLDFIKREVAANSSWMQIVTSAAQARAAIKSNKLAIVLGVEMDTLGLDKILDLVQNHGVRHVVPIHLVNNEFGGCAVYSDTFNASNNWLFGTFMKVTADPNLTFRLQRPMELKSLSVLDGIQGLLGRGGLTGEQVSDSVYNSLGYASPATGGHKNTYGLMGNAFLSLMRAGLLIDVAHMSELSTEQALFAAERYRYPLMNSHTGLREPGNVGQSERDMKRSHAMRLAKLGGVMGLGTDSACDDDFVFLDAGISPEARKAGQCLVRFTGDLHDKTFTWPAQQALAASPLYSVTLVIDTGKDDLRGGNNDNVDASLLLRNGQRLMMRNLNGSNVWKGETRHAATRMLPTLPQFPGGLRRSDIVGLVLSTHFTGGIDGDNWNVDNVKLSAMELDRDSAGQWLRKYNDALSVMRAWSGTVSIQRAVSLGTDMNGFAPQIPIVGTPVTYPISVAYRFKQIMGTSSFANMPPYLPRCQMGEKTFDVQRDGLAHYGMIPDFLQAVSQKPGSERALQLLYRSANDVVKMWEYVEAAQKGLQI